ncbi:MAG: hypothetical protein ACOYCA_02290 [Eggerthellaceae bacterium]
METAPSGRNASTSIPASLARGIDVIDNDKELARLDEEAQDIYASLYGLDDKSAFKFDEARETEVKQELLDAIFKIKARLSEINECSFVVEDGETERLSAL